MEIDGDITDAFDDGELQRSIEAGQKGPWNDETAVFEDPKLSQLQKQMTVPERLDYQQRRLRELQRRAQARPGSQSQAARAGAVRRPASQRTMGRVHPGME